MPPDKEANANPANGLDIGNQRTQTIVEMRRRRASFQEIGYEIGVTREGARYLVAKIAKAHGNKVFESQEQLWTQAEAAREIGVSQNTIHRICARGEVPCYRRGKTGRSKSYLVDKAGIEALRQRFSAVCTICGQKFAHSWPYRSPKLCSNTSCWRALKRRQRAAVLQKEPSAESLRGWLKDLWEKLQNHRIPENEEWISWTEAMSASGLSQIQLTWLRERRVISVRPHPKRKWRGQPKRSYAASEMEIARQVLAAGTQGRT